MNLTGFLEYLFGRLKMDSKNKIKSCHFFAFSRKGGKEENLGV